MLLSPAGNTNVSAAFITYHSQFSKLGGDSHISYVTAVCVHSFWEIFVFSETGCWLVSRSLRNHRTGDRTGQVLQFCLDVWF